MIIKKKLKTYYPITLTWILFVTIGCKSNMAIDFTKQENPDVLCKKMSSKSQFPNNSHYIDPKWNVYSTNTNIGCMYQGTIDKEVEEDTVAYGKAKFLYKLEDGHIIRYIRTIGEKNIIREQVSNQQIYEINEN